MFPVPVGKVEGENLCHSVCCFTRLPPCCLSVALGRLVQFKGGCQDEIESDLPMKHIVVVGMLQQQVRPAFAGRVVAA